VFKFPIDLVSVDFSLLSCVAYTSTTKGVDVERSVFAIGSILAGLGVAFGAFAAHALKASLSPQLLATFETGVRYQMYHGLGLLGLAWAIGRWPERRLVPAAALMVFGTLVFSGSLYLLGLTGARWFGAITPFGGVALIAGWGLATWRSLADSSTDTDAGFR
jgi:uncharacterized membrane protein YgdD (TMEM256/DUF423 family)